ncbi:MAG: hypothetical protein EOM18_16305, partial [Clostridia bacterium]|nr:hypothetical protein [Clostridia bacterium]
IFIFQAQKENLKNVHSAIPEDILGYTAFLIHVSNYDDSTYESVKSKLDYADEHGLEIILEIANFANYEYGYGIMPLEEIRKLYREHTSLVGVATAELSVAQKEIFAVPGKAKNLIIDLIRVSSESGGLFIWMDIGYLTREHVFSIAGEDDELYQAIKSNAGNVIIVEKDNGNGKFHLTRSLAAGWWLSGACANWGINIEDFLWRSNGYSRLWKESIGWRKPEMIKSIFCYPDTLYAQGMLTAMSAGAVLYSFEWHNRLIWDGAPASGKRTTPTFDKVVYPFLRKIVSDKLIPDKEEVRSGVKAVYHATDKRAEELLITGESLFRGLYGNTYPDSLIREKKNAMRFLPTTGRYGILPVLPKLTSEEVLSGYDNVIDPVNYPVMFGELSDKIEYFDKLYPETYEGSCWAKKVKGRWFVTNPNENVNSSTDFEIEQEGIKISGVLHPHSILIAESSTKKTNVYLSNFRSKPGIDWDTPGEIDPDEYLNGFVNEPDLSDIRETEISIKGYTREPKVELAGDKGVTWEKEWKEP